ncbi:MAG: hypothetical protein WCJ11_01415 [Methylococcaceae bacterium]
MNYLQRISRILAISVAVNLFSCSFIGEENKTAITPDLPKKSHLQERLLFIGDSHSVGVFGRTLTALLEQNFPELKITAVASCGSEPRWWLEGKMTNCGFWMHEPNGFENKVLKASTPKLDDLLNQIKPKITIVALGSNLVLMSKEDREAYTETMMAMLENKGGECIWISAPDSRKFKAAEIESVYELLKKLSKLHHCKLIDSRNHTKYPSSGGDGLHYGGKEGTSIATQWAEKVFNHLKPTLSKSLERHIDR